MGDTIQSASDTGKRTRTPRTTESITKGAMELPLSERVILMKALKTSIDKEVTDLETKAAEAKQLVNGNK